MTIPSYDELFPYVLAVLKDGSIKSNNVIRNEVAALLNLGEEERKEMLPSGSQRTFDNRVTWALVYLTKAGLLERPKRATYNLSPAGNEHIAKNGTAILLADLRAYESFLTFIGAEKKEEKAKDQTTHDDDGTPDIQLLSAMDKINQTLADELLSEIFNMSPLFFEKLVLDLLHKMGYGGKHNNVIIRTPYSQDDGIDGLIKEDELGLDHIWVQAKRWKDTVGQPAIQQFAGALSGKGAHKGVMITTSNFSSKAIAYAENHLASKIVLIDGKKLTDLMIAYGVGLTIEHEYRVQKVDRDYFDEEG